MNTEPIHRELERLKHDDRKPAPEEGTWHFSAHHEGLARFDAELRIDRADGRTLKDGGPEFGEGELVLRLPFQDCGTPLNYVAAVLEALNLEAKHANPSKKDREQVAGGA